MNQVTHAEDVWGERKLSVKEKSSKLMDPKAGWPLEKATKILDLVKRCLREKSQRPKMPEVKAILRRV